MNKKSINASLIALLFSPAVFAADTTIYTDDVVVTASRIPQSRENVIADVTVIDREEIERAGQSTLVELLQTQPGIEIESNGGPGAAANVHLRGTSSQQVVILIDGMRVSSATLGTTSLNLLMPEQIERIEIVRGAASSLYGSDAIGGVIQIFTKQGEGKPHMSASAGIGSYNTKQAAASLSGAIDNTRYALTVSSLDTDGISSIRAKTGLDRDKDGFRNLSASGSLFQTIATGHEIGVQVFSTDGNYNFDGNNFPAHQEMKQQSFSLNSNNQFTSNWLSHLKVGESMDDLFSVGSFGISSLRTTQRQYSWQNDLTLPVGTLTLAYDRLEDRVKGNTDFSKKFRSNDGVLASYVLEQGPHAFKASLRHDDNSQFGGHDTGNIGYGYRLNDFWRVTGSYGTAFRAPTFNDLFWPFQDFGGGFTYQGNPHLKPETSRNSEISVVYDQGHHRISATAYKNEVTNLLVCCQGLAHDFPTNVGSATIEGLTLAYEGWLANFHMRANADFQSPKNDDTDKLLVRRSREHGSIWLGQTWNKFEIGTEVIASGKRFNDADNQFVLGGYTLLNLTANYKVDDDWSVNARFNNVLDKQYALATTANGFAPNDPAYGTPGANLFINVRYSPSK